MPINTLPNNISDSGMVEAGRPKTLRLVLRFSGRQICFRERDLFGAPGYQLGIAIDRRIRTAHGGETFDFYISHQENRCEMQGGPRLTRAWVCHCMDDGHKTGAKSSSTTHAAASPLYPAPLRKSLACVLRLLATMEM